MDVSLSAAQVELELRFGEIVNEELLPSIRRMGETPRDGDPADVEGIREVLWGALTDLGATRVLLPSRHGGDELGQQGAVVLAELLGSALYQGPLLDTMTATELLGAAGEDAKILGEIAEGAAVSVAPREQVSDSFVAPGPISIDGTDVTARRRLVGFAAESDYLLVVGDAAGTTTTALVRRDHPTVSLRQHVDVSGGELYDVTLKAAPILHSTQAGAGFGLQWMDILARARVRQAAYLVGLSQGALDLAVQRATERRQFGQAIGRFQAPAFSLAQVATRIEAARWFVRAVAWEADTGADVRLRAAQALAMAADLTREATSVAMQVHGAYGTTEQADIQLYFRRGGLERVWLGSPKQLRAEALPLLLAARRS